MYDAILVPTDGSDGTDDVLDHAIPLAEAHDATLHALYVVDRQRYLAAPDDSKDAVLESLTEEGERAVERAEERAAEAGLDVVTAVEQGVPYRHVLEYANEHGVDVIVMGTHGRTGRDRLAHLGSVTERVVSNASVPVFVVNIG